MGIGFARNYRLDPFFRTEVNIVGLQILFSFVVVGLTAAALALLYQSTLASIIAHVQSDISALPERKNDLLLLVPRFSDVQGQPLFAIIAASVGMMLVFGYLMVRIALAPAKIALASQKQFIGNVAHELRTPLAILRTNNDVHLMDPSLGSKVREILESNSEELVRLSDIINNLLTLNTLIRPEHIDFLNVDFGEVTDEAVKKLGPMIRQKGLAVTQKKAEFRTVLGNRTALEQITVNILKNAILYTLPGGSIVISIEPDYHGYITLTVRDSGSGIAEKDLFHIFEPYYRGDASRDRKTGGSGLGLAIVSELVRLHRGMVRIQSAPKRGTTVIVSIPAPAEPNQDLKKEMNGKPASGAPGEVTVDFSNKKS